MVSMQFQPEALHPLEKCHSLAGDPPNWTVRLRNGKTDILGYPGQDNASPPSSEQSPLEKDQVNVPVAQMIPECTTCKQQQKLCQQIPKENSTISETVFELGPAVRLMSTLCPLRRGLSSLMPLVITCAQGLVCLDGISGCVTAELFLLIPTSSPWEVLWWQLAAPFCTSLCPPNPKQANLHDRVNE